MGPARRSCRKVDGGSEHFISVAVPGKLDVKDEIVLVRKRYAEARKALGLAPETAIFRRQKILCL